MVACASVALSGVFLLIHHTQMRRGLPCVIRRTSLMGLGARSYSCSIALPTYILGEVCRINLPPIDEPRPNSPGHIPGRVELSVVRFGEGIMRTL